METPNTYFNLFLGYSAVWLLIASFVVQLWLNQRRLSRQISEVEGQVASLQNGSESRPDRMRVNS